MKYCRRNLCRWFQRDPFDWTMVREMNLQVQGLSFELQLNGCPWYRMGICTTTTRIWRKRTPCIATVIPNVATWNITRKWPCSVWNTSPRYCKSEYYYLFKLPRAPWSFFFLCYGNTKKGHGGQESIGDDDIFQQLWHDQFETGRDLSLVRAHG